jgi:hypothetical protein
MRAIPFVVTLVVLGLASGARAQTAPTAADLKRDGDAAMQSLHYKEALKAYDQAYALGHDPAVLYNRARVQQGLGDFPAALDSIEEFVKVAPDDLKQRVPHLAELVADIEAHVALVIVNCPIEGATVMIGGKVVGKTPLSAPIRVGAGEVAVAVEAPRHTTFHQDVTAPGGKLTTVNATLASEITETPVTTPPPVQPPERTERYVPAGWRVAAYTTGTLGILGIATGAVFGGLVASKTSDSNPHCPAKACDAVGWADINDAKTFATVSTISFIAGGVLVATAAVLFLVAPHATRKMAFVPLLGPGFVGIGGAL